MREKKSLWDTIRLGLKAITSMGDQLDTAAAAEKIRGGVNIRGANVWILACSIIIASVGLNVNSIPVVIGAMLISPLMGPIFGMGLSLSINDQDLLVAALKNFLVMVGVSLLAATVYFLISPLRMANPTELLARTSPTIYDVFIAFFGGIAGTLELSRKDRGTVLSGVAIATALMPPLCTVGFGLASGNFRYAAGALYLFFLNTVFILLATYFTAHYLRFDKVGEANPQNRRFRTISSMIMLAILVPSVLGAIGLIRNNNTERNVNDFIKENRTFGNAYIYDYRISGGEAKIYFAGELTQGEIDYLKEAAKRHKIDPDKLDICVNSFGARTDELLKSVYDRADETIATKEARIRELEEQLNQTSTQSIPGAQIAKELKYKYPCVSGLTLSRGSSISMAADSIAETPVVNALVQSSEALSAEQVAEITLWLRLRMEDTTVVVHNIVDNK